MGMNYYVNMKKQLIPFIILLFLIPLLSWAQEYDLDIDIDLTDSFETAETDEMPFSLYGYMVNYSTVNINTDGSRFEDADIGNTVYMRLKGDFYTEEALHFHFEASYSGITGNQNYFALYDRYGLVPSGYEQSEYPYDDFVQSFSIDHLWGSVAIGSLDLQFGKIPIAWGTGYLFNPSSRVVSNAFMETVSEETPGTIGFIPSVQVIPGLALQGYLSFQDKNHQKTASLNDGNFNNLPFGIKIQTAAGSFDVSVGFIKEVINSGVDYSRNYFLSSDFAGALWDFGVYGETVLRFSGERSFFSPDNEGYNLSDSLEIAVGFDYRIPKIDVVSRVEYYHHGPGESSKYDYDISKILSGELLLQGEEYLFMLLERDYFNYLTLSAGGMINLNDYSAVIYPNISYELYSNFLISAGLYIFTGSSDSEFGGEYNNSTFDLTEPAVFLRMKLSF